MTITSPSVTSNVERPLIIYPSSVLRSASPASPREKAGPCPRPALVGRGWCSPGEGSFSSDHPISTAFFGLVQSVIRHAQKLAGNRRFVWKIRKPDGDGDPFLRGRIRAELKQLGRNGLTDAFGHFARLLKIYLRQNKDNLFAAISRQQIHGTD